MSHRIRTLLLILLILAIIFITLLIWFKPPALDQLFSLFDRHQAPASLGTLATPTKGEPAPAQFLSNQIIIKFTKEAKSKLGTKSTSADTSLNSLRQLNAKYQASKLERLAVPMPSSDLSDPLFDYYILTLPGPSTTLSLPSGVQDLKSLATPSQFQTSDMPERLQPKISTDNKISQPVLNFAQVLADYHADPNIEVVEPNYLAELTASATPNDPFWLSSGNVNSRIEDLWGLKRIDAEEGWGFTTGSEDIIVAVIDSGVDYRHPDIKDNIWTNPGEIPGNGIDDDGNGYIDDYYGWNFGDNNNDPVDHIGHGTHVAGIIGATGNNELGVVGVSWQGKVMALNVHSGAEGSFSLVAIVRALQYAADMGAKISNNSYYGIGRSRAIVDAIKYQHNKGMLIVASAPNLPSYTILDYDPSALDLVISVDTIDFNMYFPRRGEPHQRADKIELTAPGESILSLKSAISFDCPPNYNLKIANYCIMTGTSMATPHVAGLAALIWSHNPNLTNEEVRQLMRQGSEDIGPPGKDIDTGYGLINIFNSLKLADDHKQAGTRPLAPIITEPKSRTIQTDSIVNLKGKITGSNFSRHTVEISRQMGTSSDSPKTLEWVNVPVSGSTQPLSNNSLLARIDLNDINQKQGLNLESAYYTIRVTARDTAGRISQFQIYDVWIDRGGARRLSPTSSNQAWPDVDGDKVVWSDSRHGNAQIYLYDLKTGTERRLFPDASVRQQFYPSIDGDKVVWLDYVGSPYNSSTDLRVYDLSTNTSRVISSSEPGRSYWLPTIKDHLVIWTQPSPYPRYDYQFALYDLNTNTERILETPTGLSWSQVIRRDGNKMVYMSSNQKVHVHDLNTGAEELLPPPPPNASKYSPDISGNKVVWGDDRNYYYQIYLYDLISKEERRLSPTSSDQSLPLIDSGRVLWRAPVSGGSALFSYNLATGIENIVYRYPSSGHVNPNLDGNKFVWADYRHDYPQIYLLELEENDQEPPEVSILDPKNGDLFNYSDRPVVEIMATDDVMVTKVELYIDGQLVDSVDTFPYKFVWDTSTPPAPNSRFSLQAKAYDAAGNKAESSVVNITIGKPDTIQPRVEKFARSLLKHISLDGRTFTFPIDLTMRQLTVEPRQLGPQEISFVFNELVTPTPNQVSKDTVSLSLGYPSVVRNDLIQSIEIMNHRVREGLGELVLKLKEIPDGQIVTIRLQNLTDPSGNLLVAEDGGLSPTWQVGALLGDVNQDGKVDQSDLIKVRDSFNQKLDSTNFFYDINRDGVIDILDLVGVRNQVGKILDSGRGTNKLEGDL